MSFPDPHHPWDPPESENHRCDWRELALPPGHPGSEDAIRKILEQKPAHWLACYEGRWVNQEGGPANYRPQALSHDNIREINAKTHIMNELLDEAVGRVLAYVKARGWDEDTDIFFTTDHGEMQGDFGFIYKGPWHVDALMRLPFIWRPAPSAGHRPDRDQAAGRPARPRRHLLRHRRHRAAGRHGRQAPARHRGRQPPTHDHGMGQPVPRLRHASAQSLY
ncbi:MAG: sulfatase-like hydrolase/transferase [Aliidongia sp.]